MEIQFVANDPEWSVEEDCIDIMVGGVWKYSVVVCENMVMEGGAVVNGKLVVGEGLAEVTARSGYEILEVTVGGMIERGHFKGLREVFAWLAAAGVH